MNRDESAESKAKDEISERSKSKDVEKSVAINCEDAFASFDVDSISI